LPFAPEIVLPAIDHFMLTLRLHDEHPYGFRATFNQTLDTSIDQTFRDAQGARHWWVSPYHFGLNVGPIVLMVENFRSGLVWELMRQCRYIGDGLHRAGFAGGWLESRNSSLP